MDDLEKKLLCMVDSDFPGERSNGAELLHEHQQKIGHSCRDIVHEIENSVPLQRCTDLETQLAQYKTAHDQYIQANTTLAGQLVRYKPAFWVTASWPWML